MYLQPTYILYLIGILSNIYIQLTNYSVIKKLKFYFKSYLPIKINLKTYCYRDEMSIVQSILNI